MQQPDATEASKVVQRVCSQLIACIPAQGPQGVQARAALGDLIASALSLLVQNAIGPSLQDCFELVQATGATWQQFEQVRADTEAQMTTTLGGTLVKNSCISLCLSTYSEIIGAMDFTSRQDVQTVLVAMQTPFGDAVETAADEMDQAAFQALISLQATLTDHLVTTERPLPRMVNYQFASVLSTLVIAYRLYADASRADEIRDENKIVHPAFCPTYGVALSS
jgi:hypothetical protein